MDKSVLTFTTLDHDIYSNVLIQTNNSSTFETDYPYAFEISMEYNSEYATTYHTILTLWLHNESPFKDKKWLVLPWLCHKVYFIFSDKDLALKFKLTWS